MKKVDMIKKKKHMEGKRFRFAATIHKSLTEHGRAWSPRTTLLLENVRFASDGAPACDRVCFNAGNWAEGLDVGDHFEFDACVCTKRSGYQERLAKRLELDAAETDFHLTRPSHVVPLNYGTLVNGEWVWTATPQS